MSIAFLGLGSNLENPLLQIHRAVNALKRQQDLALLQCSSFYLSKPVDGSNQENFVNCVAKIQTSLNSEALLSFCKKIERLHGREKSYHWGPRIIDIDILLYGQLSIKTERLVIPHKELLNRDFALIPLLEIEPSATLPNGEPLMKSKHQLEHNILHKLTIDQT
jgi:2-amino-4-hydroxy-6-hydroxymethyldihydropteridine diphosphokinase